MKTLCDIYIYVCVCDKMVNVFVSKHVCNWCMCVIRLCVMPAMKKSRQASLTEHQGDKRPSQQLHRRQCHMYGD